MMAYLAAAAWGLFVLCSMIGWGGLVVRGALGVRAIGSWARLAAAGLAFSACLGGVFELLAITSRWLILAFLGIGVAAFAWHSMGPAAVRSPGPGHRRSALPLLWPLVAVAGAALVLRVVGALIVLQPPNGGMQTGSFNTYDDFQAYIVYPLKMLETGSMGYDPFSLRRTPTHALGGNAFLQTFVLAALPVQSLRLLDVALGTVVIVGLLWYYTARMQLSTLAALCVILVFLAVPPPLVNTTSVLLPVALLFALFVFFLDEVRGGSRSRRATFVGVHVAAIASLKASLVPAALAFPAAAALFTAWRARGLERRDAVVEGLAWFLAAGVAISPWIVASYRWTGVFPVSGLAAFGADPTRVAAFQAVTGWHAFVPQLRELPRMPYLYLAGLAAYLVALRSTVKVPGGLWSLAVAAAIGTSGVVLAVAGSVNNIQRLMYAFLMPATLALLVHAIATSAGLRSRWARRSALAGVTAATLLFVGSTSRRAMRLYGFNGSTIVRVLNGERLISPALARRYHDLQGSLPEGAVLLEHMDYPFLFDFRRNTVYVDDLPGSASPATGQPFFSGAERLADYLVSHRIEYVAYDYETESGLPRSERLVALSEDAGHPSARAVVRLAFDFHDSLVELGKTRERVFDDGSAFAIHLTRCAVPDAARPHPCG